VLDTTTEAGRRAERRLHEEEIAWLTTMRTDGQPQSVPVWLLWNNEAFLSRVRFRASYQRKRSGSNGRKSALWP
jgi:Pyridoxamine 5'-phosphate oxidase